MPVTTLSRSGIRGALKSLRPALALGLTLSLGGCLGYDGEIVRGYQQDARAIDQLKVGASAEQVLVVMGTPSTTSTVGGDAWYYISQKTDKSLLFMPERMTDQRVLAVYYTKAKKVERVANYGIEDGKVIDFVSRATPTGGAESTFLRGMFKNLLKFS